MARNGKVGIDYFSHDVDMLQDKKIKLIKAKHNLVGYAVYLRLLEELYRDKGYYLVVDEDFNILFADDNNIDFNDYIDILNDCINYELFDINKYEKYNILTSKRIQFNYCEATKRRKEVDLIREYLLLEDEEVNNINVNVNINSLNDNNNEQSKEEESKENESKENESKEKESKTVTTYKPIINYLNEKCGTQYRPTTGKTKDLLDARINEGFTVEDFESVIDKKSDEWIGSDMEKYLRPQTLFGTKFEGYLNQKVTKKDKNSNTFLEMMEEEDEWDE